MRLRICWLCELSSEEEWESSRRAADVASCHDGCASNARAQAQVCPACATSTGAIWTAFHQH
jgi:hypothetical protein